MKKEEILLNLQKFKVVPVLVVKDLNTALSIFTTLNNVGLPCVEITFRTEHAEQAVKFASTKFPEMIVGAGTIINEIQCEKAILSGAKFIVSPGFSKEVFTCCEKYNILYIPGVATATEIMNALNYGLNYLKFFPAMNLGGLPTIKALCSAFPNIKIMPTGGITKSNLMEFLQYDKIFACGGSWMVKGDILNIENEIKDILNIIK